ncbi:MAG: glucose-1-phosphate thymidylyltransferase RfbA [Thermoplasmatales archaeon]|nr:glucose-1-phosphate thymidylyltransferase RfbA [Thermoplasmatales archaeon]
MKGIILAGGSGTRLHPASAPISKILLPVYDKPMIYYPLSALLTAGIRDVLVITNEGDHGNFKKVLGDGSHLGIRITYEIQYVPKGIADAFIIGEEFIAGDDVVLILGDNIFHSENLGEILSGAFSSRGGATVFGYPVKDPERFGVVEFDDSGKAISLEEKPKHPKSNHAVIGLYAYDGRVCEIAKTLKPSARGELEITDLNRAYLETGDLDVVRLGEDFVWMDAGTFDSLLESSVAVRDIQARTGKMVSCPEEIALERGFVSKDGLRKYLRDKKDNEYYDYLRRLIG